MKGLWIPGSPAAPAPRNDGGFFNGLVKIHTRAITYVKAAPKS
jgi:hypothetical protein